MVQIMMSEACANGEHDKCPGAHNPPRRDGKIVFGGWRCPCSCHDHVVQHHRERKRK